MKVITYQIKLLEPVLATSLDGDPNSAVSYDFLPGGMLRGLIISRYLAQNNLNQLDLSTDNRQRFFDPKYACFLNGYLAKSHYEDSLRSIPTPQTWVRPKDEDRGSLQCPQPGETRGGIQFVDLANWQASEKDDSMPNYKPVGSAFWINVNGQPYLTGAGRQVAVHTARQRDYGRARRETGDEYGALFQYEALTAGQTFEAHLLCAEDEVETFCNLIDNAIAQLGGSRSGGYGRVRLSVVSPEWIDDEEPNGWDEAYDVEEWDEVEPLGRGASSNYVVVTLLSDLLLRDRYGHLSADPQLLAHTLGLTLRDKKSVFVSYRPIGGFNRTWGLPLPQQTTFKMGSVFIFERPNDGTLDALQKQIQLGIGERREEGFGRITLDCHTDAALISLANLTPITRKTPPALTNETSQTMAARMTERMYRLQLDRKLHDTARRLSKNVNVGSIHKNQLYRLRGELQRSLQKVVASEVNEVLLQRERQNIATYLVKISKRSATRKQFARVRINGTITVDKNPTDKDSKEKRNISRPNLARWVIHCVGEETIQVDVGRTPQVGDEPFKPDSTMIYETNVRLIDAVLAQLAKRKRQTEGAKQ